MSSTTFLQSKISEIVAESKVKRELKTISINSTFEEALSALSELKVIRAPVTDENNHLIGFVDVLDILKYVVIDSVNDETKAESLVRNNLQRLSEKLTAIALVISSRQIWKFAENSSLKDVLEVFGCSEHHVIITDSESKQPTYVFGQSDIISYLDNHPTATSRMQGKTISQLGLYKPDANLVTIPSKSSVLAAYRILSDNHRSAAPIVAEDGLTVVGTLSVTDLKYTDSSDFSHFALNVLDFLRLDESRGFGAPISVGEDAFFGEIVLLLSHSGVHRVWILDSLKKVKGVVSCSDMIKAIVDAH